MDHAFVRDVLRHLREDEFIELGVLVAQFTGMGKLFAILGIPNPAFVAMDEDDAPPP
ncbi:MAG TPA: hypothetical protein VGQ20_05705 [Acidimicrobiales bacterium]|nr:hypothetical protein [Acidimicrobiales bacterium]